MGNWNMTVVGVGCHHNTNNLADADAMFRTFVGQLKEAGHTIDHASITYGGAEVCPGAETARKSYEDVGLCHGAPFGGGFFGGEIVIEGTRYALIVAPKSEGEKMGLEYKSKDRGTPDGTDSDDNGLGNSEITNDANHPAAQFCRSLHIGGHDDWYLPSRDELAILCRNISPTRKNTPELFKSDGPEAFEKDWYWSSTEYAPYSVDAWIVGFDDGSQYGYGKDYEFGVRAVRRLKI